MGFPTVPQAGHQRDDVARPCLRVRRNGNGERRNP